MNWNRQKSVILSQVFVLFFALLLLVIDAGCFWGVRFLLSAFPLLDRGFGSGPLIAAVYLCSIPAWITLWSLWRLLRRIQAGTVFTEANIRDMRRTGWCCMMVAAVCLPFALLHPTLLVLAAAAAFMGLIVRIVRNAFQQAVAMKDELDFTV